MLQRRRTRKLNPSLRNKTSCLNLSFLLIVPSFVLYSGVMVFLFSSDVAEDINLRKESKRPTTSSTMRKEKKKRTTVAFDIQDLSGMFLYTAEWDKQDG